MAIRHFDQGASVRVYGVFTNSAGTALDPTTVKIAYRAHAIGTTTIWTYGTDAEVVRSGTGIYYADIDTNEAAGAYDWNMYATGTGQAAKNGMFHVRRVLTTPAPPSDPLTTLDGANVTFLQAGADAISRSVRDRLRDWISVKDFGAAGDGTTDDTTAFAAAAAWSGGRAAVYVPPGTYKITDTVTFALNRLCIYGAGQQATIIKFAPTTTGKACFHFTAGASQLVQVYVRGMAFDATGNTQGTKAALRFTDCGEVEVSDVAVSNWSSAGKDCIAFQLRGRQTHWIHRITVNCDKPVSIEDNPNSTIDIDHYHFEDCYFIADLTQPVVTIASGVNLSHVTFDGYQAWVQGKHGLYWVDTGTSIVSTALTLKNVRWEQATDNTGYFVRIEHNTNLYQLNLENCYGGLDSNWVYLRKVVMANLKQTFYVGTLVGLDANSTVTQLNFDNTRFNDASATITLAATNLSGTYFLGGNAKTFLPAPASGGGMTHSVNPSTTLGFMQWEPAAITVNSSTVTTLASNALSGILLLYSPSAGVGAAFIVAGSFDSTTEIFDPGTRFGAAAGASDYNIYSSGGEYKIQNNTGTAETFKMMLLGTGEH